ncbi:hypothetical protein C8Q77DRAFT_1194184 [Trametes polyzona]|nr:hypothetical protein C8Q77DRAFT_1194184 [Trametes polyzona]
MAVVIASSHCSSRMSSAERMRTPPPADQQGESGVDANETSATGMSFEGTKEAQNFVEDPDFAKSYLSQCKGTIVKRIKADSKALERVDTISNATTREDVMYRPLADLLSDISKDMFDSISSEDRKSLGIAHAIVFIDQHDAPPSHFPVGDPRDKPDLVGAFSDKDVDETKPKGQKGKVSQKIPYHRLETVVEAKPKHKTGGPQCASYLYRLQQARPDRPGAYGLYVRPKFYQIFYSNPVGTKASKQIPWHNDKGELNLDVLCKYVYSLYDPLKDLFLYDPSVKWVEPLDQALGPPSWTITVGDDVYEGAAIEFIGNAWGRRTTVFRVERDGFPPIIIKEGYVESGRRYEESALLNHAHAPGFLPGVVRVVSAEDVQLDGRTIAFQDPSSQVTKTKRRVVLADTGVDLEHARSVNDLMKTFYDVLEVHRTLARERHVLHRDMSIFNILMYPMHASCVGARWQDCPPLIDDILGEPRRADAPRTPRCLLIDFDHSAKLVENDEPAQQDLRHRTGTPMYIARAVAAGEPLGGYASTPYAFKAAKMPLLSVEAKQLYVKAYGEDRYDRYNDVESTCHGGTVPLDSGDEQERPFHHRWEYDAESVFWTMYSVLLRVLPKESSSETEETHENLVEDWKSLNDHRIGSNRKVADSRAPLLEWKINRFSAPFLPGMRDVATTLHKIALQVIPSYAVMPSLPPYEDHLHEAMQRLILDYLVAHRDHDIPLQPGMLRNTGGRVEEGGREHGMFASELRSTTGPKGQAGGVGRSLKKATTQDSVSRSSRKRAAPEHEESSQRAAKKRIQPYRYATATGPHDRRPRKHDPPVLQGQWEWPAEPAGGQPPSDDDAGDDEADA